MFAQRSTSVLRFAACLLILSWVANRTSIVGQENGPDEELARQQKIVERFVSVLEKNPRRGTALDRVYGAYVETGTLDQLVTRYQDRVKDPKDTSAWMILGLIESQRGRDAAAVEAFAKAAAANPKEAIPSYYLGQSLVLVGQPEQAVAAFEEAIRRKPAQNDLLEIFQALGRVHQRAQHGKEALEVWARLEKLFPGDARVQEQIAAALVEDGQHALALPRYEALLKLTKDDYRKSVYKIEAAELKVKLNRSQEATADLEKLLSTLNPTSWLHREVRRKIEEVYLRTEDQDGLAKYYQGWLVKNPEDVDAMARLARLLARQARVPEAQVWLDKALKLAPSRKELRQTFIQQLIEDQRYADAIAQYELLDKADPNNPDFLREWGKLILRDTSRPKEERLKAAEAVWRRLLAARPKDPLIATQVADLFRHADITQAALDLYQKAVELAPDQPQYLEYLGEYYHQLKRTDEALSTWRKTIAGKKRTAESLARLAEVLSSFGYLQQAIPEIQAACELDPKDFSLQLKAADLFAKAEKYAEALAALGKSEKLAQNADESEAVLASQLKVYQLEDSLTKRTEELAAQLAKGTPTAKKHFLLARYYEALRQYPEATRAIDASLKLEPQAVPALGSAARIYENAGDLKSAADLNRKLAVIDRRGRSDYLKYVAQLESQLGRIDEALKAGKELIASAPGNTENYEFYANLCFRLGQSEEGLQALRRAMRVSPNDPKLILVLAEALAGQYRTDEAIELYWQAFDKSPALDDRLGQIQKLTELYMQTNHFDKLLERVERLRRDAEDKREMTICLSQAYSSAGDFGMARQELESLLSENSRDTQLLSQLSKLSSTEGDLTSAVKYQEQLAKIAPGPETEYPLATLLAQTGAAQESAAILVRLTTKEEDPEKLLKNLDALLAGGQHETVLLITESKLREEPKNWELLYREGVALAKVRPDESAKRFQAILDLPNEDIEWGVAEKNRLAKAAKSKTSPSASPRVAYEMARLDYSYQIRMAVGLMSEEQYYGRRQGTTWSPVNFAQARFASIGWRYRLARDAKKDQEFATALKTAAERPKSTPRETWDWIYAVTLQTGESRGNNYDPQILTAAKKLATEGDTAAQYLFIESIRMRSQQTTRNQGAADSLPPLPRQDLELLKTCYDAIATKYNATPGSSLASSVTYMANVVLKELHRAGRLEEEQKLFNELVGKVQSADEIAQALMLAAGREDFAGTMSLFDKWKRTALQSTKTSAGNAALQSRSVGQLLLPLMGTSGASKKDAEVLNILDHYLDFNQSRATQERQRTAGRPKRATSSPYYYYTIYYGKSASDAQFAFPAPGEYYDFGAINVLRNAYEVFLRNDVLSDLQKHLRGRLEKSADIDKVYGHLALAYLAAWSDNKEEALKEMAAAAELVPQDWQMRMEVARLHQEMQNFDEALTLVNSIAPLDQDAMRERETLALNLAVRLGDHERAMQAAERLFGLRLDADTQVQLASQMRRLGMNEQAEAVMSRAQRQAGSRLTTMVTLMNAYQAEGRSDVALQIAYQILRRSRTQLSPTSRYIASNSDEGARRSALQVLGAAGKLKEMIAATEEQVKHSPQATQLVGTLAEYYEAAGEKEKSLALEAKLVEQKKDDATFRYRYAQKLAAAGKRDEACEQYKIVLKQQPRLLGNDFYEVLRIFRQAKKEVELSRLLGEIDLRQMGQYHYVVNLVSELMEDPTQRPAAIVLLKKTLEAFPESRSEMFSRFYNEEIWDQAEIYEYGKQALIPQPADVARDPWVGLGRINSFGGDGVAYSLFSRILSAATKRNELPKLRDELAKAIQAQKDWKAGPLILAAVEVRLGNLDAARPALEAALSSKDATEFPMEARWLVGLELEPHEQFRDTVLKIYEGAMQLENRFASANGFQYSPGPRLLKMYLAAQRRDDAKKLLVRAEKPVDLDGGYPPGYAAERRIETLIGLASQYEQIEDSADALRLYREILTSPAFSAAALQGYGGNAEYYQRQARQRVDRLTAELASKQTPELVRTLLAPSDIAGKPVLDLMLGVQTEKNGLPKIGSQLVMLVASKKLPPEAAQAAKTLLQELTDKHPQDMSLRILATLLALREGDQEQAKSSLSHLKKLVLESPLEELPPLQRANSRQRETALRQVALWLVAAECLKVEPLRADGEILFSRALEAAARQLDTRFRVAMLSQRAQAALQAGDKPAAKERLEAILAIALTRPVVKKPAVTMGPPSKPAPVVKNAAAPATVKPAANAIAPITLSQFKLAMLVAHLTAEHGLEDLAIKGARESLLGGLPVADANPALASRGMVRPVMVGEVSSENSEITQAVTTEFSKLSAAWRVKKYPSQEMYGVLEAIVFPSNRPDEILLYQESLSNWNEPGSLGRELVRWSIAAKQEESLRTLVASRSARPAAGLAGKVLLVFLAVESKQYDQAAEPLRLLTQAATGQQRPDVIATAAPAAARAFSVPELQEAALPLMQSATKGPSTNQVHVEGGVALLGKYYIAKGKLAELKAMHEAQLQIKLPLYAQYGGDYGIYQQRNDLANVVSAIAPARNLGLTLEYLGRALDIPVSRNYGESSLNGPLSQVAAQLGTLPPNERYSLLRDWTLPTDKRRSLRFAAAFLTAEQRPAALLPAETRGTTTNVTGLASTFSLLIDAAKETGKLDELQAAADAAAAEKLLHARTLQVLVALARNDKSAAARVQAVLDDARARSKAFDQAMEAARNPRAVSRQIPTVDNPWDDIAVLRGAYQSDAARELGRQMFPLVRLDSHRGRRQLENLAHLCRMAGLDAIQELPPEQQAALLSPGLRLWTPGTPPQSTTSGYPPAWWTAHANHVTHIAGNGYDSLFFKYPLTGTFEFSFETHSYDCSQGEVAYGGLICHPQFWQNNVTIFPVSQHETVTRGGTVEAKEHWNKYSVQVSPQAIRFYSNGHLAYEEQEPSSSSPWLHLVSLDHRRTDFRKLRLTGNPSIPRQVELVHGNRLEGWASSTYDVLPQRLTLRESPSPQDARLIGLDTSEPEHREPVWSVDSGVLHGRHESGTGTNIPSHLFYHRPLEPGETIRYEFLYEPGKTCVHPALGKLAFLLQPSGVQLKWISSENSPEDGQGGGGAGKLPLKDGQWNEVQLSLAGNVASLKLNGELILERELEPTIARQFGLFYYREQMAAQIRNIVLSGNWPEKLAPEDLGNLLALESPNEPPQLQRARHALVREEELVDDAYDVWIAARALPPEERYKLLAAWVLPSDQHPTFRLQAGFTPTQLASPAVELVRAAAELKRLSELEAAVNEGAKQVAGSQRDVQALQVLMAASTPNDTTAAAHLKLLGESLKSLDPNTHVYLRYPELVAIHSALQRPALRTQALALAEALVENQQNNYQTLDWEKRVRALRAHARWLTASQSAEIDFQSLKGLTQWTPVSFPTAEFLGKGFSPALWKVEKGKAEFFTGSGGDSLYFRSPLQGDFEVHFRRTTYGWKEMRMMYGGTAMDVHADGLSAWRFPLARPGVQIPLPSKLPGWGEVVDCKLVVKGGDYRVLVGDTQIHTQRLGPGFDPWLAIQTKEPHFDGRVENVQIIGTPTVPDVLQLSAASTLASWRADFYGETIDDKTATWSKDKDEIVGKLHENSPGSKRESLLQYHRPLLEDGEIEYEFYYEDGKTLIHPALGRTAFVLSADGVRLHQLTSGAFEKSGLTPDNESPLEGSTKPLQLANKAWNRVKLSLTGNVVTVHLAGEKIGEHKLSGADPRFFGLFRYSDATATRVRNVTYRGNWPKEIPPSSGQELALPK